MPKPAGKGLLIGKDSRGESLFLDLATQLDLLKCTDSIIMGT